MTNFEWLSKMGQLDEFLFLSKIVLTTDDINSFYNKYGIKDTVPSRSSFINTCARWLSASHDGKKEKCTYPPGLSIKPDGIHELDPCVYQTVEVIHNADVRILKCKNCGHIEVEWSRSRLEDDE